METVKVWNVQYVVRSNEVEHCVIQADHFIISGENTIVFYKDVEGIEAVAIFTSIVNCTLDGVVPS